MDNYKHFISLGYFCSIALELERMGLRSCSSPFDWCISEWSGVEKAITTHFENFLNYDNLYQSKKEHMYYMDAEYGITFFHDFNKYKSLEDQLPSVQNKYQKRIDRFFENIKEPTLFVRYISNEKNNNEINYLEKNYDRVLSILKNFNEDNDIIFIANDEVISDKLKIYSVKPDENDLVARRPLDKNEELKNLLDNIGFCERQNNYKRYIQKQKKENRVFKKYKKKIIRQLRKTFCKPYLHSKQF